MQLEVPLLRNTIYSTNVIPAPPPLGRAAAPALRTGLMALLLDGLLMGPSTRWRSAGRSRCEEDEDSGWAQEVAALRLPLWPSRGWIC